MFVPIFFWEDMGVYNEICFRQRILWEVVVQNNHSVSGRFGGADGLYGGYTVVNGDNERICYALNQRLRDTVPIGKAFWNDGFCTSSLTRMAVEVIPSAS